MGRDNTKIMKYIDVQFDMLNVSKHEAYKKTCELLSMYRELRWFATVRAKEEIDTISECGDGNLENALVVLEIFASGEKRRKIKENVNSLFFTKRLIAIIDEAIIKLRSFPFDGECYYEIIKDNYLSPLSLSQEAIAEKHHYERSEYYQKKKQAIFLVALSIWE